MKLNYQVEVFRKNRNKFVNWFIHQKPHVRRIICAAYMAFYQDRGIVPNLPPRPFKSHSALGGFLFDELLSWSVQRFVFMPESEEVILQYHPFIYQTGVSSYLHREKELEKYNNE